VNILVVFSHGKETGPNGRKISQLREVAEQVGAQTISIDYTQTVQPEERVQILLTTELPAYDHLILVGSSMGGYVSTRASEQLKPDGLVLMAPAFGMQDYPVAYPIPHASNVAVVHGWQDEAIPVSNVIVWAKEHQIRLQLVNDDHSLHQEIGTVGHFLVEMIARLKTL
jgi:alpha/beta superfamily hydrolase